SRANIGETAAKAYLNSDSKVEIMKESSFNGELIEIFSFDYIASDGRVLVAHVTYKVCEHNRTKLRQGWVWRTTMHKYLGVYDADFEIKKVYIKEGIKPQVELKCQPKQQLLLNYDESSDSDTIYKPVTRRKLANYKRQIENEDLSGDVMAILSNLLGKSRNTPRDKTSIDDEFSRANRTQRQIPRSTRKVVFGYASDNSTTSDGGYFAKRHTTQGKGTRHKRSTQRAAHRYASDDRDDEYSVKGGHTTQGKMKRHKKPTQKAAFGHTSNDSTTSDNEYFAKGRTTRRKETTHKKPTQRAAFRYGSNDGTTGEDEHFSKGRTTRRKETKHKGSTQTAALRYASDSRDDEYSMMGGCITQRKRRYKGPTHGYY
ncbi:hypothetical protein FQN57_003631, partial [Myotisia sp. PD_48]